MSAITYVVGDATRPVGEGGKIIAHICNDVGGWGAGFTGALSRMWRKPEEQYRAWWKKFALGDVQIIDVEEELHVANMFAQRDIVVHDAAGRALTRPLEDMALALCLLKVFCAAHQIRSSVHMPRIGCGLAGGKWEEVEPIIVGAQRLVDVPVFVYDLPPRKS